MSEKTPVLSPKERAELRRRRILEKSQNRLETVLDGRLPPGDDGVKITTNSTQNNNEVKEPGTDQDRIITQNFPPNSSFKKCLTWNFLIFLVLKILLLKFEFFSIRGLEEYVPLDSLENKFNVITAVLAACISGNESFFKIYYYLR